MPLIKVREDESLENALRRFKRKCEKSGILTEIKKRQHYEKKCVPDEWESLDGSDVNIKRRLSRRKEMSLGYRLSK